MRLPKGYPHVALFSVGSILALIVVSGRWAGAPAAQAIPTPAAAAPGIAAPGIAAPEIVASAIAEAPALRPTEAPPALRATEAASAPRPPEAADASGVSALAAVGGREGGSRSRAVEYGDRGHRRVALTFDAGADVGYAAEILDILARERAVASFGVTGTWAEQNPALVKRIAAEGHQFINHTWSHGSFTGLSTGAAPLTRAQRWDELDRTEAAIQRIAGVSTLPTFRPPYGDVDASVLADVGARGYTVTAMWAVDSAGWNGLSAPRIVERTLRLTSPGAILIFHVGSQSQDAAALPAIIGGLRAGGYEFVSVAALAG